MKKQVLSILFSSVLSVAAFAAPQQAQDQQATQPAAGQQEQDRPHMDPEKRLAFMTKKLNLTADQQNQLRPILQDEVQQMQAVHNDASLSKQDRFSKMRSIREDAKTKIQAVLTDSQKQTLEQMQAQHGERHNQEQK